MYLSEAFNSCTGQDLRERMPKDNAIKCSVTVMPVVRANGKYKIGFVRRHGNDSYLPGTLVAPGGKLEKRDGKPVHAPTAELLGSP
jgi:8-oxo-dGTP pyrophosphatase MutT (NUDIX family)